MPEKQRLGGVHLFAGAGGMVRGLRSAGFGPSLVFERDRYAYRTLATNGLVEVEDPCWDVHKGEVGDKVDWGRLPEGLELLAGGVPCQPFSLAGKHLAERDGRNMFPEFFRAAHYLRPKAIFVENVFGLTRESFQPYFQYILRRMRYPSILPRSKEVWQDHDRRIRDHEASGAEPEYHVVEDTVNAADYGVPQCRRRVFIVATRADLRPYEFPPKSHSRAALIRAQTCEGYWSERGLALPSGLPKPRALRQGEGVLPWVTVRDALADLWAPAASEADADRQHWIIPGARAYKGHTGSRLDWPSKALKAGVNGVPGGENTVVIDGNIRYYTFREAARIQTFPDDHVFHGSRKQVTKQIGNAVPCLLAEVLARPLFRLVAGDNRRDSDGEPNA